MNPSQLKKVIAELKIKKISVVDISNTTGYSEGQISKLKNGKREITNDFIYMLKDKYGDMLPEDCFAIPEVTTENKDDNVINMEITKNNNEVFLPTEDDKEYNSTSYKNLTESNRSLSRAQELGAEALVIDAQARLASQKVQQTIADGHAFLMKLLSDKSNLSVRDEIPIPVAVAMNRMIEVIAAKFGGEKAQQLTGEIYNYVYENPKKPLAMDNKKDANTSSMGQS